MPTAGYAYAFARSATSFARSAMPTAGYAYADFIKNLIVR